MLKVGSPLVCTLLALVTAPTSGAAERRWVVAAEGPAAADLAQKIVRAIGNVRALSAEEARREKRLFLEPAPPSVAKATVASLKGAVQRFYYLPDPADAVKVIEETVKDALALL